MYIYMFVLHVSGEEVCSSRAGIRGQFTSLRIKRPHGGPGPTMAGDSGQAVCTILRLLFVCSSSTTS